jgi:hypothetical protein
MKAAETRGVVDKRVEQRPQYAVARPLARKGGHEQRAVVESVHEEGHCFVKRRIARTYFVLLSFQDGARGGLVRREDWRSPEKRKNGSTVAMW